MIVGVLSSMAKVMLMYNSGSSKYRSKMIAIVLQQRRHTIKQYTSRNRSHKIEKDKCTARA
jgi:hypothetical protein